MKRKPGLRITGVVSAMNRVRQGLSLGIPASEVDSFRHFVRETIETVETICYEHRITPAQLPAPTYRAYQFLKSLHLEELSINQETGAATQRTKVRIKNVVAACNSFQTELNQLANHTQSNVKSAKHEKSKVKDMVKRIQATTVDIESALNKSGISPDRLPVQSRRAYQWLIFLSEPSNLATHLETLKLAYQEIRKPNCRKKPALDPRLTRIEFNLFSTPFLYRARKDKDSYRIVVNQGFCGAPPDVIHALVCTILTRSKGKHLQRIRDYTNEERFQKISSALSLKSPGLQENPAGQHYDLVEIFNRVNEEYYSGDIERPILIWNRTITHRKLGHYQPSTDTVMISITLDNPGVPSFVLDYVMYHELLHKLIGVQEVDGRHYAHSPSFKIEERKFRQYAEAKDFLKNYVARFTL